MKKNKPAPPKNSFGGIVRRLRMEKKMTGAELCRNSGMDPRTLTALEKGRIRNPSLDTMTAVASGLGLKVSDIFRQSEQSKTNFFYTGTQKGFFQMDFPSLGIKVVSFTPMVQELFCGKLIFGSRRRLEESFLPAEHPVFLSVLVGRFEAASGNSKIILKEGDNLFLKGTSGHTFQNALERESVLLAVTAPSFLGSRRDESVPIFTRKR